MHPHGKDTGGPQGMAAARGVLWRSRSHRLTFPPSALLCSGHRYNGQCAARGPGRLFPSADVPDVHFSLGCPHRQAGEHFTNPLDIS